MDCRVCGKRLTGQRKVYCSYKCNHLWYQKNVYSYSDSISKNSRGAFSELAVMMDLLQKGYEVFRSISPTQDNDIIAIKEKTIFVIDAKSGRKNVLTGKIYFPRKTKAPNYAVYVPSEKKVYYYPEKMIGIEAKILK